MGCSAMLRVQTGFSFVKVGPIGTHAIEEAGLIFCGGMVIIVVFVLVDEAMGFQAAKDMMGS